MRGKERLYRKISKQRQCRDAELGASQLQPCISGVWGSSRGQRAGVGAVRDGSRTAATRGRDGETVGEVGAMFRALRNARGRGL
jgi:hypothetical protein